MKYKYIISIFVVGFIVLLLGTLFKITHAPAADTWLKLSFAVMIFSALLLIIKLLKSKDDFLNK